MSNEDNIGLNNINNLGNLIDILAKSIVEHTSNKLSQIISTNWINTIDLEKKQNLNSESINKNKNNKSLINNNIPTNTKKFKFKHNLFNDVKYLNNKYKK